MGQNKDEPNLLDFVDPNKWTILPNTAGCFNAEDAIRTCQLSRELLDGKAFVKLEVLGEKKNLFPHMSQTIEAAKILIDDGFEVLVYCSDDPIFCQ
jgi:thiazole synthase